MSNRSSTIAWARTGRDQQNVFQIMHTWEIARGKPMLKGVLLKRYKRFFADVRLDDGCVITAHCPNPGSMLACSEAGQPVLVSDSLNPERKLRHTWEMIQMGRTWVGVNTATPNAAVAAFVSAGAIPELCGYAAARQEVKYGREGRSRIDILLSDAARPDCYVEIKNATMRVGEYAAFPDAVTERGLKHLNELADVAAQGMRAVMFFFIGRGDCKRFRPADEIDPDYGKALRRVTAAGVELLAYRMKFSPTHVTLDKRMPTDL